MNADNEDDSSDHKVVERHSQYVQFSKTYNLLFTVLKLNRPELIYVLDVGQHDSITFSGHKELLITRLLDGGQQLQVVSFSIDESIDPRRPVGNKSTSQIVWQTRNNDLGDPSRITLTSALPLEQDSIIQGFCALSMIYMIF